MNTEEFLEQIRSSANYRGQIAHIGKLPERPAQYSSPEHMPSEALLERLRGLGITRLYSHQAAALDAIAEGKNVVLVTDTASGKTLAYNLPVLDRILSKPSTRALYLFPTKALAQDQLGKLGQFGLFPKVRFATYDGDTPTKERSAIRKSAHVILTNPDMLHLGILPNHEIWRQFFQGLEYVVVDEIHTYRGVFGAHMGNILRRLQRIAEFYGASPKFICCSATIGNPRELAQELTGQKCEVIDNDGSPKGERTVVFWNPPEIGEGDRRSPNSEVTDLFSALVSAGIRNIIFTRARITAELVLRYARQELANVSAHLKRKIESYRGGYTPEERREIEQRLFNGDLLGVAATNALELGVDIGGLDAVVMNGYPGTTSSLWQQAGRAGRAGEGSLAIMVAHNDPLEQYLIRHPEMLIDRPHEEVRANPGNPYVLASHIRCAAHERPIAFSELEIFGQNADKVVQTLEEAGLLEYRQGRWYHAFAESPAKRVDIRSASGEIFSIVDLKANRLLGTIEGARVFEVVHEGAIYLHRGEPYEVTNLDLTTKQALVIPSAATYYTDAINEIGIVVNSVLEETPLGEGLVSWGGVTVTEHVIGYRKRSLMTETTMGYYELDLPPRSFDTVAIWLRLPGEPNPLNKEAFMGFSGGAHAIEHVASALVPALVSCDRRDIGSAWYAIHPVTLSPTIFIYDTTPGGVGLAEGAYKHVKEWLEAVRSAISECSCQTGCPGCVLSPRCSTKNENVSKIDALNFLDKLLA